MCAAHATVRGLLHDVTEQAGTVVIDMEAGLEHLSRGTPRYVDTLLLVAEPYFKSMETAARSKAMAEELGIPRILAVPNKVRGLRDEEAMRSFFTHVGLPFTVFIPAPVVNVVGTQLAVLFAGALLTETVFGWPGLGRLLFDVGIAPGLPSATGDLADDSGGHCRQSTGRCRVLMPRSTHI